MIRGITLEGVPEKPTAKQRPRIAAAREALDEGKKRLSKSISSTDTEIDPGELLGVFDGVEKVLIERGQYTKKLFDHLVKIISAHVAKINTQETETQKYIDDKIEVLRKEMQQINVRSRTGINRLAGGF